MVWSIVGEAWLAWWSIWMKDAGGTKTVPQRRVCAPRRDCGEGMLLIPL